MTERSLLRAVVLAVAVLGRVPPVVSAGAPQHDAQGHTPQTHLEHSGHSEHSGYVQSPAQLWPAEVVSPNGVVVSGSDQASQAGAAVLEAGGNAVDAAVAVAFALGVTEPMTSGLGSETFVLIRSADGRTHAIDGSCYVPNQARPDELQKLRDAAPRGYLQDYQSIATPGSLAALAYALGHYGTKSLSEVMAPAINLAEFGYRLSVTGQAEVEGLASYLRPHKRLADLLLKDFTDTWDVGHVFCSSDLASTLGRIAASGPGEFYHGSIANTIDADMKRNNGYLRKEDLVELRAIERQPILDSYRDVELITFPFPGGGASLVELLHILQAFPSKMLQDPSLDRLHLLVEAARIAWVDNQDSKLPPPLLQQRLTDVGWAAQRAKLIRLDRALLPEEISKETVEPFYAIGTTQVSVVDRWGNVVGLSQTLGGFFGAGVITPGLGFLYNSNLNAFSYKDPTNQHYLAPGRAPATAMTPTILLKNGKPVVVLGSAGSERVIPSMVSVISAFVDRGLGLREAVATPRAIWGLNWSDPRPFLELAGEITPGKADALEQQGFKGAYRQEFPARWIDLSAFGGTNAVFIDPRTGSIVGVPDPRRSGFAAAPAAH